MLFFGAARDAVGQAEVDFVLHGTPTTATAFASVLQSFPELERFGRSLLFAVNQEYARADREVHDGDELAVFPPVSGGAGSAGSLPAATLVPDFFELTTNAIDVGAVARRVVLPECGASVTLDGYAREWTRGRRTLYLVYEAYAPMVMREQHIVGFERTLTQ